MTPSSTLVPLRQFENLLGSLSAYCGGWGGESREAKGFRLALGGCYLLFGGLKFFPNMSPAENLAALTLLRLGIGSTGSQALLLLAVFECAVGLLLLSPLKSRYAIIPFLLHMAGTFLAGVVAPEFVVRGGTLTLEGQYILKNVVWVTAARLLVRVEV